MSRAVPPWRTSMQIERRAAAGPPGATIGGLAVRSCAETTMLQPACRIAAASVLEGYSSCDQSMVHRASRVELLPGTRGPVVCRDGR